MANIPRVAVVNVNYQTGVRRFSVQNEDDLAILPRYNVSGTGDIVSTISSTAVGSRVFVRDTNDTYELNADNEWQKVSVGSSGGGGGTSGGDEYVDESDIDDLFK